MIKFFRRIRRKFLSENRISKYLVYALGEIVLVVIGILIALYLNNLNELKTEEDKIVNILREIQKDLKLDIAKTKIYYDRYIELDSLQDKVLNKEYSYQDYEKELNTIGRLYNDYVPLTNGYDNLKNNLNIVPKKYDSIVTKLKSLYEIDFSYLYTYNARVAKTVYDYLDVKVSKKWSLDYYRGNNTPDVINYFLNDLEYRNYVLKYVNDRRNLVGMTEILRIKGTELYNDIEKIISKDKKQSIEKNQLLKIENRPLKKAVGKYRLKEKVGMGWVNNIHLIIKDNQMKITDSIQMNFSLIHHRDSIYILNSRRATYIKFNKNNMYFSGSTGGYGIYEKVD